MPNGRSILSLPETSSAVFPKMLPMIWSKLSSKLEVNNSKLRVNNLLMKVSSGLCHGKLPVTKKFLILKKDKLLT